MAKKVERWESDDGKIHTTEYDADLRNSYLKVLEDVREEHYRDCCEDAESLIDFVLNHRGVFERLLNMPIQRG
jgi:hypothetical protein